VSHERFACLPEILERPTNHEGVLTFDLAVDGRE
jgi:hypothetical protein